MAALGIDFGTSNTAAAVADQGRPRVIALEPGQSTMPTIVFLDFDRREVLYGSDAAEALIEGREGRFMRSLKSILGTPLARETRHVLNERMTLIDIIARFLAEVKARAEATTGTTFDTAVSGRPVHFHSHAPARDRQALEDLTEAYARAGFRAVRFLPEPEAAALAGGGAGRGLIVDIGGGTSDFTVFDAAQGEVTIRASHGVRLGGTDFDKALSLAHVMPLLGMGAELRKDMGPGTVTAPVSIFTELASWEKIPFLYSADLLRDVRRMERQALTPRLFTRLGGVLEMHLGHDVAYAVEAGKIAANGNQAGTIDLNVVEKGLMPLLAPADLARDLAGFAHEIRQTAAETLAMAECGPEAIDRVVFVGGSSLMAVVRAAIGALLPDAEQETSEVFTAVVDGLALAAGGAGRD
ncbi:molecular chaperone DnaK [Rhodovulum sp. NI22]|nr:molecular chaperone DnaK [Rhodovulum sp. NI22]